MNKLPHSKRALILNLLCEGSSMQSIFRVADAGINTVSKLLRDAARLAKPSMMRMSATSALSGSSAMRFGPSSTPRRRT